MQAVDTSGVEPLAHPLEATQRLRPDAVTETDHRDAYQTIAPPWKKVCTWFRKSSSNKDADTCCIN